MQGSVSHWQRRQLTGGLTGLALARPRHASGRTPGVDLALVIAADVSSSIQDEEVHLQRLGAGAAMTDPVVLGRARSGLHGAVAVAYVEWSGLEFQQAVLGWTRIGSPEEAAGWSAALRQQAMPPGHRRRGTSISGAIGFSLHMLEALPWRAARSVIDVSGDGINNSGRRVQEARDEAVALGVTINGLAIEGTPPSLGGVAPPGGLGDYYRGAVIGGPGAFVQPASGLADFGLALRRKLAREISGREPADRAPQPSTGAFRRTIAFDFSRIVWNTT